MPAARVFVPYNPPVPETVNDYPTLSGFAAGPTKEAALLSSILEVIERDTFMIAWANRLNLLPVALDDDGDLAELRDVFRRTGIEVRVGLIQLDLGAPVAIALAHSDRPGHPAMVVSAAASMSRWRACRKAMGELTANWLNVHHALATKSLPISPDPTLIRDETAHGLLYAQAWMSRAVDFWWFSEVAPIALAQDSADNVPPGHHCKTLISAITTAGLEPLAVDLTSPEIGELGLHAIKCLIPGTYPMNFDALWPHLGGRRISEAPVRAGLRNTPTPNVALSRLPHPFP